MKSRRTDAILVSDMLEAARRILEYTGSRTRDGFLADRMMIDAVVRNLEIIGEAANRVSPETRAGTPGITWQQIIGLRNRIVHDYFGVDTSIVWEIISHDLSPLCTRLESVLSSLPPV